MKTILFDMDGVLINSEPVWEKEEAVLLPSLLGQDIYEAVYSHILGNSIHIIYDLACEAGACVEKTRFLEEYNRCARKVYGEAELNPTFIETFRDLKASGCKVGLVSNSPPYWMGCFLARFPSDIVFDLTFSIAGLAGCKPKPEPDIYVTAMKALGSSPSETIVIEDTTKGLEAGKRSGAFTIFSSRYAMLGTNLDNADLRIASLDAILPLIKP